MSDIPPPISRMPRRERPSWWPYAIVGGLLCIIVGVLLWLVLTRTAVAAAPTHQESLPVPQPHSVLTFSESTGGKEHTKGNTLGSTVSLSGDTIAADDLKLTATVMSFDGLGSITGGGFGGSFKVSAGTLRLLVWACIILGFIHLISATLKWVARDYLHAAGQGLAALGFFIGAANPEFLGWCFVISSACSMFAHAFPSLAAKAGAEAEATLGKLNDRLNAVAPGALAQATALLPDKSKLTLAKAAAKRSKT